MDRWIAATHFGKDLFGGHATVHEPDPISLAVLVLDLFNKGPQRGFVGGIAAQHLVSQWQALRSDDQGDDDLHAIGAFITAVTEAALVAFRKGRIAFKIGARQIVKQDVNFYAKQGRPSLAQKLKGLCFMLHQTADKPIKSIFGRNREVLCEQIAHCRVLKPYSVKAPLTARIQQSIAHQRLEHVLPIGAFATATQSKSPELIELKLFPQLTKKPTAAPLPRPM